MFNGKIVTWKKYLVYFELKEDAKQIYLQPYPVLKVNEEVFKKWVELLVLIVVFEVANDSQWGSPYFAGPRPKSNQVRF